MDRDGPFTGEVTFRSSPRKLHCPKRGKKKEGEGKRGLSVRPIKRRNRKNNTSIQEE